MKKMMRGLRPLLVPASAIVLFSACGGESQSDTTPATTTPPAATVASGGEQLYQQRCVTCHQADGRGIAGSFPPLAGSEYANASNVAVPILIVMNGIAGPLTVHGQQYNGLMPPYGVGIVMSDEEIASLLTYVRSSWGNQSAPITAADVARVRAMPRERTGSMSAEELAPMM